MEEPTSAIDGALLGKLRRLASRGARLQKRADGTGLIESTRGRPGMAMSPAELLKAIDGGWMKAIGADQFVLSRRGTALVRNLLARPGGAARAAATAAVPRAPAEREVARQAPRWNPAESPLTWLRQRRGADGKPLISAVELDAGERLRRDFELAQMGPRVTASWDFSAPIDRQARGAPGAGHEVPEVVADAHMRVARALKAVGPEMSGVLVDVCCLLYGLEQIETKLGWPRRSGKIMLQKALSMLARHYGLVPEPTHTGPARVLHWGADGYRPTIDGAGDDNGGKS